MRASKKQNAYILSLIGILLAICLSFISIVPVTNLQKIQSLFDASQFLSNLPLWIFMNALLCLYSKSQKESAINTTLFNVAYFVSYTCFSVLLKSTTPNALFLSWTLWTTGAAIASYFLWNAQKSNTEGIIFTTILLTLFSYTAFTSTKDWILSISLLNLCLYIYLIILLYKGKRETIILVILSLILGVLLHSWTVQIIFTKSACINLYSVLL